MRTNMFGETGAHISFFRQRVELAAADLNDGKLAGDEESVQRHQDRNDQQFQKH